jgi:hypothetical protein
MFNAKRGQRRAFTPETIEDRQAEFERVRAGRRGEKVEYREPSGSPGPTVGPRPPLTSFASLRSPEYTPPQSDFLFEAIREQSVDERALSDS